MLVQDKGYTSSLTELLVEYSLYYTDGKQVVRFVPKDVSQHCRG